MEYDLRKLAKYPFLDEAKSYVASLGIGLEGMTDDPVYSACIEKGRERVISCINGEFKPDTGETLPMQLTVLSYPIARIIANSLKSKPLFEKYALGEAKAVGRFLEDEDDEVLGEIVQDLDVKYYDGVMPLAEYLRLGRFLARRNSKWKLVNRVVDGGMVRMDVSDFKTILNEAVRIRVMQPLDVKNVPEKLKVIAKNINASMTGVRDEISIENVDMDALPECIQKMIAMLETGSASHNAMFILATFFLNLGLNKDDVLKVFMRSPDYKEDLASYQIEFLSGEKGGTAYTCPTCETIKSYGLGCSDCTFRHPLQKYRVNARENRNAGKYKKSHNQ
ncbi:MAG: hypothetical protein ABIH11_00700 [Candidatus Altiarchaeota archaeon]